MRVDHRYASYLMNAANLYAASRATDFKASESWFEKNLMTLFEEATKSGVEVQDIAVIASTAIAVLLTKTSPSEDIIVADFSNRQIRVVETVVGQR
jgi:hypothetical protein